MPEDRDRPSSDPSQPGARGIRKAPLTGDVLPRSRRPPPPDDIDELPSMADIERFNNVTRMCPECKKEVFDDAALCYHCGYAFERTTAGTSTPSIWIYITVAVLLGAFIFALARGMI